MPKTGHVTETREPQLRVPDIDRLRSQMARLRALIAQGFSAESAAPGFPGSTASTGQCAAVAAIVNGVLGGKLLSTRMGGLSHWLNRLEWMGEEYDVDLTGDQFGFDPVQVGLLGSVYPDARVRISSELNSETRKRALTLLNRTAVAPHERERATLALSAVVADEVVLQGLTETETWLPRQR